MVSQRSMQRTYRAVFGFWGLSCLLLLGGGCGQSEGGRCQVGSDCADGLVCSEGTTGNGVCRAPGAVGTLGKDAAASDAAASDTATDLASATGPETPRSGPEVGPEAATPDLAEPDAAESEAGSVDTGEQG
jgi:hypothetical protein